MAVLMIDAAVIDHATGILTSTVTMVIFLRVWTGLSGIAVALACELCAEMIVCTMKPWYYGSAIGLCVAVAAVLLPPPRVMRFQTLRLAHGIVVCSHIVYRLVLGDIASRGDGSSVLISAMLCGMYHVFLSSDAFMSEHVGPRDAPPAPVAINSPVQLRQIMPLSDKSASQRVAKTGSGTYRSLLPWFVIAVIHIATGFIIAFAKSSQGLAKTLCLYSVGLLVSIFLFNFHSTPHSSSRKQSHVV